MECSRKYHQMRFPSVAVHIDLFRYVGLSVEQVTLLREKYHIYLQDSGRISIAYVQYAFFKETGTNIFLSLVG